MSNETRIESLYESYERAKVESKEAQLRAKGLKDEMIDWMNEKGVDEWVIDGLDGMVQLTIGYPEKEVLNKKGLAEALGVKQKELSKPQAMIRLTEEGKLTSDLLASFTTTEERMQFTVKEFTPEEQAELEE